MISLMKPAATQKYCIDVCPIKQINREIQNGVRGGVD